MPTEREVSDRPRTLGAATTRLDVRGPSITTAIETVEHVYLHAVDAVDDETRRDYLQQAYRLGHEFESGLVTATASGGEPALTAPLVTPTTEEE